MGILAERHVQIFPVVCASRVEPTRKAHYIRTTPEHHPAALGHTYGLQVHPFVHECALYELRAPTQYFDEGSQRPQQCPGQQQRGTTLLILCWRRPLAAVHHRRLPLPGWHYVWIRAKPHTVRSHLRPTPMARNTPMARAPYHHCHLHHQGRGSSQPRTHKYTETPRVRSTGRRPVCCVSEPSPAT